MVLLFFFYSILLSLCSFIIRIFVLGIKKKKLARLPLFKFAEIYNRILPVFKTDEVNSEFTNLRSKLLNEYVKKKKCNLGNCFSCSRTNSELPIFERRKLEKLRKTELLIDKKSVEKTERYMKLKRKAFKYGLENFGHGFSDNEN